MTSKHSDPHLSRFASLQRRSRLNILQALGLRAGIVMLLMGIALAGHWFDRDGLRDNTDGHVNFVDVMYFTAVTVTTVGYGDIVPVTDRTRLFDTFVVTPIRIFVWLIFLGTAYAFLIQHTWDRIRTQMLRNKLVGHTIVVGFGAGGEFAVEELLRSGHQPSQIVVIDENETRVQLALTHDIVAIEGDATDNRVLEAAEIHRASALLVSTSRDDAAALIVLSARQLNKDIPISVTARARDNEDLLYQAGATFVINPIGLGGQMLARSSSDREAVEYLKDLTTVEGRVLISQRNVTSDEIGKTLSELKSGFGLRIIRAGKVIGFQDAANFPLLAEDVIIEIVAT